MFHTRNCEDMVLTNDIARALLAVGRHVAVGDMDPGQTLVAGDSNAFETREKEERKPTHVDLVGS